MPILSPFWLLLFTLSLGTVWAKPEAKTTTSPELIQLSKRLSELQAGLQSKYGITEIFIGGGSSRAILDHAYRGLPLQMRDLDVFVIANQPVTSEFTRNVGQSLQSAEVGKFSDKDVRPRPRANPSLPLTERNLYNAGYGTFFIGQSEQVLDLSIYHSANDLKLNGLFNVDRIMVKLGPGDKLVNAVNVEMRGKTYDELVSSGRVIDTDGGYQDWRDGKLKLINWTDVKSDPVLKSIRLTRSFSQSRTPIDPKVFSELKLLIQEADSFNRLQFVRNLGKLLQDKDAARELKILAELGAIGKWSPELQSYITTEKVEKLESLLKSGHGVRGPPKPLDLIHGLISKLEPVKQLHLLEDLALVEPETASLWRKETLRKMTEGLHPVDGRRQLMGHLQGKKTGYFTGEFGPFHNGHLEVARAALREGRLDQILIVATPHPTNDPKSPKFDPAEWAERTRFIELATEADPRIIVWPPSKAIMAKAHELPDNLKLGKLVDGLEATQILGGDSLHRLIERNFINTDPRPRIVVKRLGVPMPAGFNPALYPGLKVIESPLQEAISATYILQTMGSGVTPKNLHPQVLEELKKLPRYQEIIRKYAKRVEEFRQVAKKPEASSIRKIVIDPEIYSGDHSSQMSAREVADVKRQLAQKYPGASIEMKSLNFSTLEVGTLHILNTGKANVHSGKFLQAMKVGAFFTLVESAGAPLSPLFDRKYLDVLKFQDVGASCVRRGLDQLLAI